MRKHDWEPIIPLLGTMTDRDLAIRFDVPHNTIAAKRNQLSIPAHDQLHVPRNVWNEDNVKLLGTIPDELLGRKLGVSITAVQNARLRRGIPALLQRRNVWSEEALALLGTMLDKKLAARLGVSNAAVSVKRKNMGIARFKKTQKSKPAAVQRRKKKAEQSLGLPRDGEWSELAALDQPSFFAELDRLYKQSKGERLSYPRLSELCLWSVSRLQKWFTAGSAQENLQLPVRHHIWLAVRSALEKPGP
ncbi:hypothetical protein [Pseudomonas sp. MRSN 12121]|uniref:hypothetical protein n=1 Tax=Pseudomonas sp. MRSN 12121 TaxID=1611770 RepID=UPI0005BEAE57|nr:hypothetical protein [Pseudomonas sp. MRSN 12121]AJO79363.1 hypothetical protein TO66_19590 [Pseudomonas sp. MRSN 12121]